MQCHINVEAINTIATVFYVFKYMFKGDDKAFVEMNEFMDSEMVNSLNYNEINSYEDFRYISACEAHWRLSDFWMYRLKGKDVNHIKVPEKLLYSKIGITHVWDGKAGQWSPRKKMTKPKLCRLYNVNPKRTNCKTYESNREACVALGLVLNDKLYEDTLFEALNHTSPNQFRYLFARLLAHCDLGNPLELFDQFEDHLTSDLLKKWQKDDAKKVAWRKIVKSMINQEKQLSDYPQLEAYMNEIGYENEETVDLKVLLDEGWADYSIMNDGQKAIVDPIIKKIQSQEQIAEKCCISADGPGGCGKSYLFNAVQKLALGHGKKVMIMAWSGIAASLYPNSGIKPLSPQGQMLKELDIIIWDEFPMAPKRALEVVDSKLKEIMGNDIPFGGKILLSGGDFRQIAPIVENATRQETINRRFGENPNEVKIPEECLSKRDIIEEIFGDVIENYNPATVMKRAILATWNQDVGELNEQVLELFDQESEITYHAQDVYHYGDEILQGAGEIHENYKTRNIKGLPSFKL
uniref:ATP-dependent DNA helicase n=1 Tax=Panagrolaimus sp. PS1159 TaxID=55785 RepID=A0AC35GPA9_9BILA